MSADADLGPTLPTVLARNVARICRDFAQVEDSEVMALLQR